MKTYDVHQHLWPAAFVDALQARPNPPRLAGGTLTTREGAFSIDLGLHDPSMRLRMLDRDGIDVAVLSLQPSLGFDALAVREREALEEIWAESVLELVSTSEGRFAAFSPSRPRNGFVGLSIGASAFADFERIGGVLDAAAEAGDVVFVHPEAGEPSSASRPDWWNWVTTYPSRAQEAYLAWLALGRARWPGLRVVFAILGGGGPFQLERLARRGVDVRSAVDTNTFFDVATHGRRAIELCVETFGVGQLVYGSDLPVIDSEPTLAAVRGFGDAVARILQSETPGRLLT